MKAKCIKYAIIRGTIVGGKALLMLHIFCYVLFIMYAGVMLLLYNYHVRMCEFILMRVVIGYSSESLLRVAAQQEHTVLARHSVLVLCRAVTELGACLGDKLGTEKQH